MKIRVLLFVCLAYIVMSAYFFEGGECSLKKKKLLKAAKFLLLGAALKGKKTFLPIPFPIPFPFKSEKHFFHKEQVHIPIHKTVYEPIYIHESHHGGYHDNWW